ncbi:hypothetical protein PanWU01x14_123200 [Parasponia andersonii]|uniref:Uncharacterized protein n=1 Tax=Parasponia andersonii TaxID=3476 RepID=A0A2P5CU77_PARAD|nr:hypothetical protein PanWU01x14_123200 [Parasponia andersonii]
MAVCLSPKPWGRIIMRIGESRTALQKWNKEQLVMSRQKFGKPNMYFKLRNACHLLRRVLA